MKLSLRMAGISALSAFCIFILNKMQNEPLTIARVKTFLPQNRSSFAPAVINVPLIPVRNLHEWNKPKGMTWLDVPSDMQFRILWKNVAPQARGHVDFSWLDIEGAPTQTQLRTIRRFKVVARDDEDARGLKISPDGTKLLYARVVPNADMDIAHDEWIADLQTGKSRRWEQRLFDADESWAPNSEQIAFIAGSIETAGSTRIAEDLELRVSTALGENDRVLKTDDGLESVEWTPDGDVLASVSGSQGEPANIWKCSLTQTNSKIWQKNARSPVASPDGKHVAFWSGEGPDWGGKHASLCVADVTGRQRSTLTHVDESQAQMFWAPDNQTLYLLTQHPERTPDEEKSSEKIFVSASLRSWNVTDNNRTEVEAVRLRFSALFGGGSCYDFFGACGFSRDGKYLFLQRVQRDYDSDQNILPLHASSLSALRMSDSKVLPLAVWNSDFAIRP